VRLAAELGFVRRLIGFRNIVVHEDVRVDMGIVHSIVSRREYRRVATLAARLLDEAEKRG
jgi:uncharacterized protein YutE (UPF0331/DUF86 family)